MTREIDRKLIRAVEEIVTAIHRLEYGKHVSLRELRSHEKKLLEHLNEEGHER